MFSLILTCLLSPAAVPTSGPELTIVRDGKTNWVIVVLPSARSLCGTVRRSCKNTSS